MSRRRCARCGTALPSRSRRYCGPGCRTLAGADRRKQKGRPGERRERADGTWLCQPAHPLAVKGWVREDRAAAYTRLGASPSCDICTQPVAWGDPARGVKVHAGVACCPGCLPVVAFLAAIHPQLPPQGGAGAAVPPEGGTGTPPPTLLRRPTPLDPNLDLPRVRQLADWARDLADTGHFTAPELAAAAGLLLAEWLPSNPPGLPRVEPEPAAANHTKSAAAALLLIAASAGVGTVVSAGDDQAGAAVPGVDAGTRGTFAPGRPLASPDPGIPGVDSPAPLAPAGLGAGWSTWGDASPARPLCTADPLLCDDEPEER